MDLQSLILKLNAIDRAVRALDPEERTVLVQLLAPRANGTATLRATLPVVPEAPGRRRRRVGLHWTQQPKNRARVMRLARQRARHRKAQAVAG